MLSIIANCGFPTTNGWSSGVAVFGGGLRDRAVREADRLAPQVVLRLVPGVVGAPAHVSGRDRDRVELHVLRPVVTRQLERGQLCAQIRVGRRRDRDPVPEPELGALTVVRVPAPLPQPETED